MPRYPKPRPATRRGNVEPAVGPYIKDTDNRAVPGRTRSPDIGAYCHDTRKTVPKPVVRPPSQPRIGLTDSDLPGKQSAYDRQRRQGRR